MLDRHADVVNDAARDGLGSWIRGRLKHGVMARSLAADEDLAKVEISVDVLRAEWAKQRAAQLSLKNRTYCPRAC